MAGAQRARRDGVVVHLIDIAIGLFIAGALLMFYAHYYGPFATPQAPLLWQNLAIVPVVAWRDVQGLTAVTTRPEVLAVAALPFVLIGVLVAIVRSSLHRWLRIVCHAIAGMVFVIGSIAVVALLRLHTVF